MRPRPRRHHGFRPAAERRRETFLDHHIAIQAVLGQVGDAEPARVQIARDRVLPLEKLGAGLQFVNQIIQFLGRSLDRFLLSHHAHPSSKIPVPVARRLMPDQEARPKAAAVRPASSTRKHQSSNDWMVVDDGENGALGWNLEG